MQNRRSVILGAALGSVVPSLVRADSLVEIPGDPLTKHGLRAASQWATESFCEMPACRLVFASGYAHRWFKYQNVARYPAGQDTVDRKPKDYAVALEVAITDAQGRRFVSSHPVDGVALEKSRITRLEKRTNENLRWIEENF